MQYNKNFEVIFCAIERNRNDEILTENYHNDAHFIYVIKGSPTFYVENTPHKLKEGNLLFIPERALHKMPASGKETIIISVRCVILDEYFKSKLSKIYCIKGNEFHKNTLHYVSLNYKYKNEQNQKNIDYMLSTIALSLFQNELTYTDMSSHLTKTESYSPLVKQIIFYIEKNFVRQFKLSELSEELNYNANYLCRIFKKETGFTIIDRVNFSKVRRATDLIIYRNYDISTIVIYLSFNSFSYFSEIYKKYSGFSATDLKKLMEVISKEDKREFFLSLDYLNIRPSELKSIVKQFENFKIAVKKLLIKYEITTQFE